MTTHWTPLLRGIALVGVGRHGNKNLPYELISAIHDELSSGAYDRAAAGAFLAALWNKGVVPPEKNLESALPPGALSSPEAAAEFVAIDAPEEAGIFCARLLRGETLSRRESETLGDFILSDVPGDCARGFFLSFLRVRYETDDEYAGLLAAMTKTIAPAFSGAVASGPPLIQIAEPFDGMLRSWIYTPVVAEALCREGYRVAVLVGPNAGPKYGMNLRDLAIALGGPFLRATAEAGAAPAVWYVDQVDLAPAVARLSDLRRRILKRPFLATLEKFLDPLGAGLLVVSAVHLPYREKMLTIAERAGFARALVVCRGLEGTMAFSTQRETELWSTVRGNDGYARATGTAPVDGNGRRDERVELPSVEDNAALIRKWKSQGNSGSEVFDEHARVTIDGIVASAKKLIPID